MAADLPRCGSKLSIGSLAIVEEWLDAVNRADGDRLEQLTHEEVEIVGPRDSGYPDGRVLSEWLGRARFSAGSLRWFCGADGTVVVEQDARWVDTISGGETGRAQPGSEFLIDRQRVAKYVRHDAGLERALAAAGLDVTNEVTERRE